MGSGIYSGIFGAYCYSCAIAGYVRKDKNERKAI